MCFTDFPGSFHSSEYVLVGYADTSYMLPGLGYIIYEFVIEHSLKGFENTKPADLPNVILVLGQKYGYISPGKRIIFVDQINTNLYQLQTCGSSFPYSQVNRAKKFYGDAFPAFDTTHHGGYASLDYRYSNSHRASYFSKSNALIADLQKNGDVVSKMTRQKNHLLIVCCLVTFFLGMYQLQYAFDRRLDRGWV
jgi:hypothetical protein